MAGYFPVDHGDMDHPVFGMQRRPFTRWEAYCWLLDHAAFDHQTTTFQRKPVVLQRGQVAISLGDLARTWKWTRPAVQRFIKGLISANFLADSKGFVADTCKDTPTDTPTDTGPTVLTLCKYGAYSFQNGREDTVSDTPTDTRSDTMSDTVPYMLRLKKRKKDKNHHPSDGCQQADEPQQDSLFPSADVVTLKVDQEQAAFDAYNAMAERLDLRACRSFSPERRAKMRQRLRDVGGIDGWMIALDKVSESHFIRSWRTGGWSAFGLHSLLQQETLARLMDDAYKSRRMSPETRETDNQRSVREYREQHGEDSLFHEILSTGTRKP